jgi:hypothetical protein
MRAAEMPPPRCAETEEVHMMLPCRRFCMQGMKAWLR